MEAKTSRDQELEALRQRVADLESEVAQSRQVERALQDSERRFRRFTELTAETIIIYNEDGIAIDISSRFEEMFGYPCAYAIGRGPLEFIAPEYRDLIVHNMRSGYDKPYEAVLLRKDGTRFDARLRGAQVEYGGRMVRIAAVLDITELKAAEAARRAASVQEEVIRAQQDVLAALSTPLLPISDGVVVAPLIGELNAARAAQMIETLTRGVAEHRAQFAILDITGTTIASAPAAEAIMRASGAVGLLGARVVLTGVSPEVAQTLVELGVELGHVVTRGTLQQGVAYALRRTGAQRPRGDGARPRR